MDRTLNEEGERLKGNCGVTVGCRRRVAERELWSEIWVNRESG